MARRLDATEMLLCVFVVLAVLTRQMVGLPNVVRIGKLNILCYIFTVFSHVH